MSEEYIAQCKEFKEECAIIRKQYRRGLMSEEGARKAFAQVTASIFGGCSGIYRELWLQDFEPCFED